MKTKSKIRAYQSLYKKYDSLAGRNAEISERISSLNSEKAELENEMRQFDSSDLAMMTGYMQTYAENDLAEKDEQFQQIAREEAKRINVRFGPNSSKRREENARAVRVYLTADVADKVAFEKPLDVSKPVDLAAADNAGSFPTLASLNNILSKVFRLGFLDINPLIRIAIVTAIFLFLIKDSYNLQNRLIWSFVYLFNVGVWLLTRISAKSWIRKNQAVYISFIGDQTLRDIYYRSLIGDYRARFTDVWLRQINTIRQKGVTPEIMNDPASIYNIIRNDLDSRYSEYSSKIDSGRREIAQLSAESENNAREIQKLAPELIRIEPLVGNLITDNSYNKGVLTSYVSAGFSPKDDLGVRRLISFRHGGRPVMMCYSKKTHSNGERFRAAAADLIERFMKSFYQENYYGNIEMTLVDFEGLYFPESRTQGLMNVLRDRDSVKRLFDQIKATRRQVDSQADGKLSTINPVRLSKRENPIKYNIVFFVGYDLGTIDVETSQLFVGGENFGFIPVIFMEAESVKMILEENGGNRSFANVIRKIRDTRQLYSMEQTLTSIER